MTDARTEARWDHRRDLAKHDWRPGDPPTVDQREAVREQANRMCKVAYLTAYLDTLLQIGAIPEEYRVGMRATVNSTRAAFALPPLGAREATDA